MFVFLIIFSNIIGVGNVSVSPRWALASYSCMMGKTEFIDNRNIAEMDWKLFAGTSQFNFTMIRGNNANSSYQVVDVLRIVPYPQVCMTHFILVQSRSKPPISTGQIQTIPLHRRCRTTAADQAAPVQWTDRQCLPGTWRRNRSGSAVSDRRLGCRSIGHSHYRTVPQISTSANDTGR